MKDDKEKIWILYIVIAFLIVLIVLLIIITILNIRYENVKGDKNISTTTRRITTSSTKKVPTTTDDSHITEKTTTKTTKTTTSKKGTTNKTTKSITTKKESNTSSVIPVVPNYETTNTSTNYPNAIDDWEWKVVDAINQERKKKGLNELRVATRLRTLAEEAADYWYEYSDDEIDAYLEGFSHYAMKSNNLNNTTGYEKLIERTRLKTNVMTNKHLQYVGVGVIYLERGINGIKTHYYVIIYE